ncbi:hypothetical protein C8R45DRAFT_948597 [Mycena sanguinolenta]|nr:hypothetical protein C8R45DRAFT_948597 [Mycena sanguinolenta]
MEDGVLSSQHRPSNSRDSTTNGIRSNGASDIAEIRRTPSVRVAGRQDSDKTEWVYPEHVHGHCYEAICGQDKLLSSNIANHPQLLGTIDNVNGSDPRHPGKRAGYLVNESIRSKAGRITRERSLVRRDLTRTAVEQSADKTESCCQNRANAIQLQVLETQISSPRWLVNVASHGKGKLWARRAQNIARHPPPLDTIVNGSDPLHPAKRAGYDGREKIELAKRNEPRHCYEAICRQDRILSSEHSVVQLQGLEIESPRHVDVASDGKGKL